MSLKAFHIVFIAASVLLALGVGAWEVAAFVQNGETITLIWGLAGLGVAALLVVYGVSFLKKLKRIGMLAVALVFLLHPQVALACETCFGAAVDNEVTRGIGLAMLMLLVLVSTVFAGIFFFFKNMADRMRRLRQGTLTPTGSGFLPPASLN